MGRVTAVAPFSSLLVGNNSASAEIEAEEIEFIVFQFPPRREQLCFDLAFALVMILPFLSVPSSSGTTLLLNWRWRCTADGAPFSSLLVGNNSASPNVLLSFVVCAFQFPPRREQLCFLVALEAVRRHPTSFQFPPRREQLCFSHCSLMGCASMILSVPSSSGTTLLLDSGGPTWVVTAAFSSLLVGNNSASRGAPNIARTNSPFQFPPRREQLCFADRHPSACDKLFSFSSLLVGNNSASQQSNNQSGTNFGFQFPPRREQLCFVQWLERAGQILDFQFPPRREQLCFTCPVLRAEP